MKLETKLCVTLFEPDEETFKRVLNFINAGEMIRCVTVVEGREKEKSVIFDYTPRDHSYTGDEYQSWLKAKALAQKAN